MSPEPDPFIYCAPLRVKVKVPAVALKASAALLLFVMFIPPKFISDVISTEAGSLITRSPLLILYTEDPETACEAFVVNVKGEPESVNVPLFVIPFRISVTELPERENCPSASIVIRPSNRFDPVLLLSSSIPYESTVVVPLTVRTWDEAFKAMVLTADVPMIVRFPCTITAPLRVAVRAPVSN